MNFWLTLIAYQAVWFCAVIGAGQALVWPGLLATTLFASWRLAVSARRDVELKLIATAFFLGLLLENAWVQGGLIRYAAPWPLPVTPAWLMALWVAFALTIVPLFGYLHARPMLAALLGAVGGPLAYLGAAHGWHAATLAPPTWQGVLALAAGWAVALPLLTSLARHWLRPRTPEPAA